MKRGTKWFILVGSFIIYLFDALEIAVLSFALPAISAELKLTPVAGGLLATATLLGMGCSSVVTGWVADNRGRRNALIGSMAVFVARRCRLFRTLERTPRAAVESSEEARRRPLRFSGRLACRCSGHKKDPHRRTGAGLDLCAQRDSNP